MDFGEHLADLAADGIDISVPVPIKPKPQQEDDFQWPEEHDDAD